MTGTFRKYVDFNFNDDRLIMIRRAADLSATYEAQGIGLTVRQLYYQFVARNWIENNKNSYERLGSAVNDGRLAGLISWTALEDRTRNLRGYRTFDGPGAAITAMVKDYKIDMWANQVWRPEVWVEKDALVGVIGDACSKLRVDFFACKGYNSQSEQWRAGRRLADYVMKGQRPIVFHLGDHDPSGIDMTRDNQERLSLFAGTQVQVVRLALNMPQIEELKPPPNYVKFSDSRSSEYEKLYGGECWELDALPPEYIHDLIKRNVLRLRDLTAWEQMEAQEADDVRMLEMAAEDLGYEQGN